jgi:hypothetical protein
LMISVAVAAAPIARPDRSIRSSGWGARDATRRERSRSGRSGALRGRRGAGYARLHRRETVDPDAAAVPAQVTDQDVRPKGTVCQFPRDPVRVVRYSTDRDPTVTLAVDPARPQPAIARDNDPRPEAHIERRTAGAVANKEPRGLAPHPALIAAGVRRDRRHLAAATPAQHVGRVTAATCGRSLSRPRPANPASARRQASALSVTAAGSGRSGSVPNWPMMAPRPAGVSRPTLRPVPSSNGRGG